MIELPEGFDSIFRYIVVVSQRAEQLIGGAKPRTESRFKKKTLEARDDVDAGLVEWRVLSQEELDAQRQAIVEQFRAEVAGEELMPEAAQPVPDVLPSRGQHHPFLQGPPAYHCQVHRARESTTRRQGIL